MASLGLGACSAPVTSSPAPVVAPQWAFDTAVSPGDTSMLGAVVRDLKQRSGLVPLRVDPRAFVSDTGKFSLGPLYFVSVPDSVAALRVAVIRGIGADTVNAEIVGQNANCPSPHKGQDSTRVQLTGCPDKPVRVAATGIPVRGTAELSPGTFYERWGRTAKGFWSVRVILTYMTPRGATSTILDYVLGRHIGGQWHVVGRFPLMAID